MRYDTDLPDYHTAKRAFEREYLRRALEESRGNISHAAAVIGWDRAHVHRKLKQLGMRLSPAIVTRELVSAP